MMTALRIVPLLMTVCLLLIANGFAESPAVHPSQTPLSMPDKAEPAFQPLGQGATLDARSLLDQVRQAMTQSDQSGAKTKQGPPKSSHR